MKKIVLFVLCMMLFVMPITAHAEEALAPVTDTTITEEVPVVEEATIAETIVEYLKANAEEIMVVVTLLLSMFYEIRKHGKLNLSIGTLNNNAVTIAENSAKTTKAALAEMYDIAEVVKNYKEELATLLANVKKVADERESLEATMTHVEALLRTSKRATIELSNEIADLLVLANIPQSKKEELYSRHRKAVDAIAAESAEVTEHDGKIA